MTAAFNEASDTKSQTSYKSTPSSRSSILERGREFTRKMDHEAAEQSFMTDPNSAATPQSQSTSANRSAMSSGSPHHHQRGGGRGSYESSRQGPATPGSVRTQGDATVSTQQQSRAPTQGSQGTRPSLRNHRAANGDGADAAPPQEAVVSPELLVDALSGHEDGLLAIAERMMEHYDRGYDAMGEAIIDAFADVQKLFQHVVEAAHMEGAAFEASRREEEMQELRRQAAQAGGGLDPAPPAASPEELAASPAGPVRHDEFIDQDVKDCLNEAIRQGASLRDSHKFLECFELYEHACQNASSLLPVDSDHRGRLQLSIARADSMSPDRGCAILRYAMDDVLRSGLQAGKIPLPDPSKRADVVLSKPKVHPSMNGSAGQAGVVQSSEEQLNSLVEEMKEILEAPVYKDTPLQDVAKRFWMALNDTQKQQNRNEERLEQNLGKLKGEFLLARAEWEEKLSKAEEQNVQLKQQVSAVNDGGVYLEEARKASQGMTSRGFAGGGQDEEGSTGFQSFQSHTQRSRGAESIASFSNMAQHARTLVGQFNCAGMNDRMGPILATEMAAEGREDGRPAQRYGDQEWRDRRPNNNNNNNSDSMAAKKAFAAQPRAGAKTYQSNNYQQQTTHRVVDV